LIAIVSGRKMPLLRMLTTDLTQATYSIVLAFALLLQHTPSSPGRHLTLEWPPLQQLRLLV
jgi:hypothetical protein